MGDEEFNFRCRDRNSLPTWREKKIVSWENYDAHKKYFERVYEECSVQWAKKTHVRKQGIDRAHFKGASRDQVSQLSKHNKEKLDISYMPDLPPEAMHVAAGFSLRKGNEQSYYVPRAHISLDMWGASLDVITSIVFPKYELWKSQHSSENGDKTRAAHNFLYKTLPFLATVALQDGIYWVDELPDHEVSIYLTRKFPGYHEWSRNARRQLERQSETQEQKRLIKQKREEPYFIECSKFRKINIY